MTSLDFPTAFKYPFRRWVGLLNILWVLVPIYGWFLLIGWRVRILAEFLQGKHKRAPEIKHGSDFKLGWVMFWKALPGILVIIAASILFGLMGDFGTFLFVIVALLCVPLLGMHFIKKRTVDSCFELRIIKTVFKDPVTYLIALLKEIALGMIFLVMWLVLVGLPAGYLTKSIFIAEFYQKHVR